MQGNEVNVANLSVRLQVLKNTLLFASLLKLLVQNQKLFFSVDLVISADDDGLVISADDDIHDDDGIHDQDLSSREIELSENLKQWRDKNGQVKKKNGQVADSKETGFYFSIQFSPLGV